MSLQISGDNSELMQLGSAVATAMPITMACWAKITDAGLNDIYCLISIVSDSANNHNIQLQVDGTLTGDPVIANTQAGGTRARGESATGITLNRWHHCAAVFTGTGGTITSRTAYIDGVAGTANTTSHAPVGLDRSTLGAEKGATYTEPLIGSMAWPAVWSAALSAAEIRTLARGIHPSRVSAASLVSRPIIDPHVIPSALTIYDPVLDDTWDEVAFAWPVTGASWSGGTATVTLALVPATAAAGDYVVVSDIDPAGYNGTKLLLTDVTTGVGGTVSYAVASDPGAYSSGGTGTWRANRSPQPSMLLTDLRGRSRKRIRVPS